jgi:outer membrane protein assembly factor BamB
MTPKATGSLLLSYALLSSACGSAPAAGGDAGMFLGDTAHTGVFPVPDLPSWTGLLWSVRLDGPIRGSPTIQGDLLYVTTASGTVAALERASGSIRWRYEAGATAGSTPAVAGNIVVVATGDGRVHGLDATSGVRRWRTDPTRQSPFPWGHESGDLYLSSPLLHGNAVYVGNGDGALYRLDLHSGRVVWRLPTEAPVRSSPAYGNGTVYVGSADGSVYAADAETGARRWRFDTEGRGLISGDWGFDRRTVQSSPALDATTVYIGARDGFLYAIDRPTGRMKWRYDHEISWINAPPALAHGLVYAGSSDGHFLQAVDAASGAERWRAPSQNIVWGAAAIAGLTVYYAEGNETLYALDARSGAERWRWRGAPRTFSSPVLADSIVYLGADDGSLTALVRSAGPSPDRTVLWDSALVARASFAGHAGVRTYLEARGYRVLSGGELPAFLGRSADSASRSTVVFAMDVLAKEAEPLLRQFLDRGGRVVWLGHPPALWPLDEQGRRQLKLVDRAAASRLLSVSHEHSNFDPIGATATDAGRRLGLEGWWLSSWSADTAGVTVLARDTNGGAASWRKGGFIRLLGSAAVRDGLDQDFLRAIQLAAEILPR